MNEDLDINLLIQVFNEKLTQLMTEIVVKETKIKQLNAKIVSLSEFIDATKKD